MCFEKTKFEKFHKYRKDVVVIGDNLFLEFQGIGSVLIHGMILENVLDAPKLKINLIFYGIEGFHITKISLEFLEQECAMHPSSKARNNHTKDNT